MKQQIGKILKFPTKAQRRSYKKKLFSLKTTIEILVVAVGVLIAELILWIVQRSF